MLAFCLQVNANSYSQKVTLSLKESSLKTLFKEIKKQTGYNFLYTNELVEKVETVNIECKDMPVENVLQKCLSNTQLTFSIIEKTIVIEPKKVELLQINSALPVLLPPIPIKGKVTDENGNPLLKASVIIKGTQYGTTTDENGEFNIDVKNDEVTLVISYVGYENKEVSIKGKRQINVSLKAVITQQQDIVVIGYGSTLKKYITGSVNTVSSQDFQKAPVSNAEELIANKVPGLQITPTSGQPGSGSSMLIRGGASLNASNDPLLIIDGAPIEGWNPTGPGMLSQLNPNDIESFTILKDAAAAAIYGSRASNGVIIITTKKGIKNDKFHIDFSTKNSVSTLIKKEPVLSANEYKEVISSGNLTPVIPVGNASTDWQKQIYQAALGTDNNISLSGGIKKLPYRFSAGYLDQDGILKTGNYQRFTGLLNVSPSLFSNHLKINLSVKASYETQRIADASSIWNADYFDPTQPVHITDQTFNGYFQYAQYATNPALAIANPVSMLMQQQNNTKGLRSTGNLQIDYSFHFLPDLHFNLNTGYDATRYQSSYFAPANYFPLNVQGGSNDKDNPSSKVFNTFFEAYLNYIKQIKAIKSRIDITAGYSYNNFLTTNYYYPSYDASGTKLPNSDPTYATDKPSHSIISYFGRLNYSFNEKYLLTATIRDDGSSRFAPKYRWGVFPSASLAWKIKEENFLQSSKAVSDLKLRISYGITGQQDGIGNYLPISVYTNGGIMYQYNIGANSYNLSYPGSYNPNLKWEQTATSDIGIDYGFLQNRITGSVDVFYKKTKDLLNQTTIPLGVNFASSLLLNIGTMENRGIEWNIKVIPVQNKSFKWDVAFNFSYIRNKITHLNNVSDSGVGLFSNQTLVNTVGYRRNTFYLYHQVYDNGKPLEDEMLDVNKDGLINADDRYVTGKSAAPSYIMGFSTNLSYKKWTFGLSMHANVGQYIFYKPLDNTLVITGWDISQNLNTLYYQNRFSKNDQYEDYSDLYLQNASFLKLDNIYIGYNFGRLSKNCPVSLNIDASVQHVFTITKYTGQDPETAYNTGTQNQYNVPRIYALGINLHF